MLVPSLANLTAQREGEEKAGKKFILVGRGENGGEEEEEEEEEVAGEGCVWA